MNQFRMFSCGEELAILVLSSDLVQYSWKAVSDLRNELNQTAAASSSPPLPVTVRISEPSDGCVVVAFATSPSLTATQLLGQDNDLIPSEDLRVVFSQLDFVATMVNPSFSIRRATAMLFASAYDSLLLDLKDQVIELIKSKRLIVTGNSIGGSIASLFTLCLLNSISPSNDSVKPPCCITYGSPFLGNDKFQKAIIERTKWNSCFLNLISDRDPFPKSLSSSQMVPFGTYFLCSKLGCACFDEPETILELMRAKHSVSGGGLNFDDISQLAHYREILASLTNGAVYRGISALGGTIIDPFLAGVIAQLLAIGVIRHEQLREESVMDLLDKIEKNLKNFLRRSRNNFDPSKKLNDRKIDLAHIEWYMKVTAKQDGYYDSYKKARSRQRDDIKCKEEIVKRQRILTQYWKQIVDVVKKMPQKEGAHFRVRWLYGGTNYRRLIEPLDIAEYYMNGNRDYMSRGRSEHYKLLEQWMIEDKPKWLVSAGNQRAKACNPTEDSCFWAHVEEAVISCGVLKDGGSDAASRQLATNDLVDFEKYVMDLINRRALCTEVFLNGSSFMEWWMEYEKIISRSHDSPFVQFMKHGREYYS